jgi:hypothetical protein
MKYAQNLHKPELATTVQDWISTPVHGIGRAKWLLFDGAVLGAKSTKRLIRMIPGNPLQNIFFGTSLARYGFLSPHLVQITGGTGGRNWLRPALETMNGVPAVSLLDASADGETLRRCLSWLGQTRTDDGMDLYCRFADTRVTPSLMRTLVEDQLATLGQCIHEWRIVDRHGGLDTVHVRDLAKTTEARIFDVTEQLRLSDKQFSMMMKAAEADEIFQMLCEGASDLVPDENPGDFHFRLSSLVAAAHGCGLEKCKDIYQFIVIALATSDQFFRASELDGSWARMRMGMDDFGSVVTSWPDETWNALISIRAANSTELSVRGERHESI